MKFSAIFLIELFCSAVAVAQVTPLDAPLEADKVTTISVEYDGKPVVLSPAFKVSPAAGPYSYKLYLPPAYDEDKAAQFPVLFIASPGGNAGLGVFANG